jgi:hypothetical protein
MVTIAARIDSRAKRFRELFLSRTIDVNRYEFSVSGAIQQTGLSSM